MGFVFPEVVVQKVLQHGIKQLRNDKAAFLDLFQQYTQDEISNDYGPNYVEQIWNWFSTTKIPVVQAWSFNVQKIPCISIQLANEVEDEEKAAIGDYAGNFDGENSETGTGVFTVMVDIGIHANRAGDHVLWLYYIVSYILFKHKFMLHRLGLKLSTFSASDYSKEAKFMAENIWTRWIRFKATTENFWGGEGFAQIDDISVDPSVGNEPASSIATSDDVDIGSVDPTSNAGMFAGRALDSGDEDDVSI